MKPLAMCCVKYLTMIFPVGLPAKIGNPVPASQVAYHFNNSVSLNAFASKAATSAVIVGHSNYDSEFLLTVLSQRPRRHFRLSSN